MLFVVGAVLLWWLMATLDGVVAQETLPRFLVIGTDSARALLSTIVTGTMAAASVVFSMVLIALQLAASQYSPRVLRDFIRDGFQQTVMGLEIGVVAYSLLVITEMPSEGRPGEVPHLSVGVATVLAIGAVVVLLAGVDHVARSLKASSITRRVILETIDLIERTFHADSGGDPRQALYQAPLVVPASMPAERPPPAAEPISAEDEGWVQQIGEQALRSALPEGTTLWLDVAVGSYVSRGEAIGWLLPAAGDEDTHRSVRAGIELGRQRTMQQDIGYGIVRCQDVALIALSPSVNDLNTGKEVIAGIGSILVALLGCDLSRRGMERDGRRIVTLPAPSFDDFVAAAFDEIRMLAAPHPHVLAMLVRTLDRIRREALRRGVPEAIPPLDRQVTAILEALPQAAIALEGDRAVVAEAVERSGFRMGARGVNRG